MSEREFDHPDTWSGDTPPDEARQWLRHLCHADHVDLAQVSHALHRLRAIGSEELARWAAGYVVGELASRYPMETIDILAKGTALRPSELRAAEPTGPDDDARHIVHVLGRYPPKAASVRHDRFYHRERATVAGRQDYYDAERQCWVWRPLRLIPASAFHDRGVDAIEPGVYRLKNGRAISVLGVTPLGVIARSEVGDD